MQIFRLIVHYGSIAALATTSLGQADKPTMKAFVIHEYGGPEVLKYEDVPQPEPKQDQLRIRVIAAGINPVDGMIRSGMFDKEGHRAFPVILGGDISVVAVKVENNITKCKSGHPVFAYV